MITTFWNTLKVRIGSRSVRADALHIYLLQFTTLAVATVSSAILARMLGPREKGVVDLYRLLAAFILDFGMLGFGSGLLFYLANKQVKLSKIHGTGVAFSLLMGIIAALIGATALPWLKAVFPALQDQIILLTLFLAPFTFYRLLWSNIITGLNQAVKDYQIGIYFAVFNLLIIAILWQWEYLNAQRVIIVTITLSVVNSLAALVILYQQEPKLQFDFSLLQNSLRYGLVVYIGYLANLLLFRIDQLMINHLMGTAALGIYTVSVRWAEMLFTLDNAILAAALYRISSAEADESFALTKKILQKQLLISGSAAIGMAIIAYPLVYILYGANFQDATIPLILLLPGIVAWTMAKIMSQYISYNRGKQWLPMLASVGGMLLNIVLNWFLIPVLGISGASLASTIAYLFVMFITFLIYRKLGAESVR